MASNPGARGAALYTAVTLAAMLLLSSLARAQPVLTPSTEMEQRMFELEQQRARAFGLRLSAGIGYGLALVCAAWMVAELVASESSKDLGPLGGRRYAIVVPTLAMIVGAVVFLGIGGTLHGASYRWAWQADEDEQAIEKQIQMQRLMRRGPVDAPPSD